MDFEFDAIFNMTLLVMVGSLVVTLGTTLLIVGEISPVEFEVRMRALEDDS